MSKPPSYRIIRRAYADGSENFVVRMGGWLAGYLVRGLDNPYISASIDTYPTRAAAESACRLHWQQWLSAQTLFTEEQHFDPEAT